MKPQNLNPILLLNACLVLSPIGQAVLPPVAEEVEKVNHDLVARDKEGKPLQRALRLGERDVAE
jgi:hypothetical protein